VGHGESAAAAAAEESPKAAAAAAKVTGMVRSTSRDATQNGATPPQYPIESLDNGLRLLLVFEEERQIRLTEASNYLGVASSTAHRILATLQYRGFVRQNPTTRLYEPGPALGSIAMAIMGRVEIRTVARPYLERLHREFAETVHLGRLEGQNVTFIDSIEGSRAVRVVSRVGRSLPAHATSSGKAMLSTLDADALRALYPDAELRALTKNTLSSWDALEAELAAVRARGYATSNEESEEGVVSLAAPVVTSAGAVFAINVSVPKHRMTKTLRKEIATSLMATARELGAVVM
jgi:IclR family transcriptional regulator, acetate operon repressor